MSENKRHWSQAILLQLAIRARYNYENWFGIIPLISPISAYCSPFRPKDCPQYDLVTQFGFTWFFYFIALSREYVVFYGLFCVTGFIYVLNFFHGWLVNRLINQFKAAGYTSAQREVPIPEYDWENGDPETFYKTFVLRPHPVVLRGFVKDQSLLKELSFDKVLEKYGDEDVFLTKKELDGYPGKLNEVNNPNVYLHNSEILFNKYPEIKFLFSFITNTNISYV
jgi:hypothetical protein